MIAPMPPPTTPTTGPTRAARNPLSASPNSLEAEMNRVDTGELGVGDGGRAVESDLFAGIDAEGRPIA